VYFNGQSKHLIWYMPLFFIFICLWVWFYYVLYCLLCSELCLHWCFFKEFCNPLHFFSIICEDSPFFFFLLLWIGVFYLCVCVCGCGGVFPDSIYVVFIVVCCVFLLHIVIFLVWLL
jgi:hypothetical protein